MPPSPRPPPPPKPTFALRSERVAVTGGALRPATVVVEGDRIAAVLGPDEPPPPGVALADLAADLLVPGLIDCHTHLCIDDITVPMAYERELLRSSLPLRTLRAAARGRLMLDHGFTTVRDVCTEGAGYADVALAEAVEARLCEGPRVVPCGPGIAITGGYMPSGLAPGVCIPMGCSVCDGVDAVRAEVRTQIAAGVAWIKVFADWTCRAAPGHEAAVRPTFTAAELAAICDEAERRGGRRVAAHVTSDAGARLAIECGAASLEHLGPLSRETFDRAAARGVFLVPTLSVLHHPPPHFSEAELARQQQRIDEGAAALERARAAGVRIACGSDIGCFRHALGSLQEIRLLIELGLPPAAALAAATSEAAALLGMPDIGTIAPGAVADLALFRSPSPFDLATAFTVRPVAVVQSGRVVRGAEALAFIRQPGVSRTMN